MAFRFKLGEPFAEGCKRVALEQLERAQRQLDGADAVVAVHETRKALKRLRALLRLMRPALGNEVYRAENTELGDIGRLLSGARDRHVLLETLTKLEAASGASGLVTDTRAALQSLNGGDAPSTDGDTVRQAQHRLAAAAKRFSRMRLAGKGFDVIGPGLEASYRKARHAFRDAYLKETDEAFHEWRKGTQQHWRHMGLLSRAWEESMGARVSEARRLSQILGDDHDLALLCAFIQSEHAEYLGAGRASEIEERARERQRELRALAQPIGKRLFAEGARNLTRRIAAYWEAAVALDKQDGKPDGGEERKEHQARKAVASASRPQRRRGSGPQAKPL